MNGVNEEGQGDVNILSPDPVLDQDNAADEDLQCEKPIQEAVHFYLPDAQLPPDRRVRSYSRESLDQFCP